MNNQNWDVISQRLQFKEDKGFLTIKSGKFSYEFDSSQLPLKKVVLLNASLLGFISELNEEDKIAGVSSPEYIYSEKITSRIKEGKIANVGNEQKYDVEKIIALQPDAIITNYISTFENTYDVLRKNGIKIIFLDEYMEQKPLVKSAYLRVFGKLFRKEEAAEARLKEIENTYNSLKLTASKSLHKPLVLANEMYGNQWFLPGGKTQLAHFIQDAGATYILKGNTEEKAIPMSFEEVFTKSQQAQFWINAGNHSDKKSLLGVNPNYSKMNVFKNGKIYVITGKERERSNDFFESGVVRSDIVLKDYIKIFHPDLFPEYQLTYMKELK